MSYFTISVYISVAILSLCMILSLIRFMKGPSLPDRVISLDVLSANLLAVLAVYSILSEQTYLNVALIMSLVAFVGTMSFAYYLVHKKNKHNEDD